MDQPQNRSCTNPRSFVFRFGVILLVVLLPLTVLAALEWTATPPAPVAEASLLARQLDGVLQIRLRETFTIAAFPSLRAFASSDPASRAQRATVALNELQAWVAADSQVREVFVVNREASVILTTGKDWNRGWRVRPFIQAALAGKLDVSPVSHDVGEFSQYYAAPILDNRGNLVGALVARVAAQELWDQVNAASDPKGAFAVLVDENGVRLADGGDATRILAALAPLAAEQQTRIIGEQTYGVQVTLVRATDLARAQELIRSGALDSLGPRDFAVNGLAAQRLTTKPWTVLLLSPATSLTQGLGRLLLPLIAVVLGTVFASFLLAR